MCMNFYDQVWVSYWWITPVLDFDSQVSSCIFLQHKLLCVQNGIYTPIESTQNIYSSNGRCYVYILYENIGYI